MEILPQQVGAKLTLILTAILALGGCGQKGPLFLPPSPAAVLKIQNSEPTFEDRKVLTLPANLSVSGASRASESAR